MEVHVKDNLCRICFLFLMKNIFFTLTKPAEVFWHAKRGPDQFLTHSIKEWTKREKRDHNQSTKLDSRRFWSRFESH